MLIREFQYFMLAIHSIGSWVYCKHKVFMILLIFHYLQFEIVTMIILSPCLSLCLFSICCIPHFGGHFCVVVCIVLFVCIVSYCDKPMVWKIVLYITMHFSPVNLLLLARWLFFNVCLTFYCGEKRSPMATTSAISPSQYMVSSDFSHLCCLKVIFKF